MIGRTISHYRIEKHLGAGGMGQVFLTRDLALGRAAALKVLPEAFSPEVKARLCREAEAFARLQHPGIATFFETGEDDGVTFVAMEYVAGETLRERLRRGPLDFETALSLTRGLLEAVGHAHAVGILHRDIKPENIMIATDGATRLLDFGLAREIAGAADADAATMTMLTGEGRVAGTAGYMSPEQLQGADLDARCDLFSVGAVLYEMAAGEPAFPGKTPTERIAAILSIDPRPIAKEGIPAELNHVLRRALAREPAQRYPSAAAFLQDIRGLVSGEIASVLPDTLTILDLNNLSGNTDDAWIGSGAAETLTVELSRVSGIEIVRREEVLKVRAALKSPGRADDPQEVGNTLGCRWVVCGSYQKIGPRLRMTVRLVESLTGSVLAAENFDGVVDDIFDMQDRMAAFVVERLDRTVPSSAAKPARPKLSAYECYARGREAWMRMEKGSLEEARKLFETAGTGETPYAPALAGLATVHALQYTFTTDPQTLEKAAEHARRAIAVDPHNSEAHIWLGYVLFHQTEMVAAWDSLRTAMQLDPSNYLAPYFACGVFLFFGRNRLLQLYRQTEGKGEPADVWSWARTAGLKLAQRSVELNPDHGWNLLATGMIHLALGQFAEAKWSLERAVDLEHSGRNTTAGAETCLAELLRRTGEFERARACCLRGLEAVEKTDNAYRDTFRGACLCTLGKSALAQGDAEAARVAFRQAVLHLRGRPRARAAGHPLVQALAGLSQVGEEPEPFEEALQLFRSRDRYDFSFFWCCSDDATLLELFRAARTLQRTDEARQLFEEAILAGSTEGSDEEMP